MQRFLDQFISVICSTCFRRFLRPSSGAQNCTYSVRYCQTNTAACCYRGWDGITFHLIHGSSKWKCAHVTPHRDLRFTGCIYCEKNVKSVCRTACETLPKPQFSSTTTSTLNICMLLYRGTAKMFRCAHHRNKNGGMTPLIPNLDKEVQ
jgi:hypothetical protein